jgi:hypothetical protein
MIDRSEHHVIYLWSWSSLDVIVAAGFSFNRMGAAGDAGSRVSFISRGTFQEAPLPAHRLSKGGAASVMPTSSVATSFDAGHAIAIVLSI